MPGSASRFLVPREAIPEDPGASTVDVLNRFEPGLYRRGFGGCRIEDVVLVTEDGYELLTDFPDELAP